MTADTLLSFKNFSLSFLNHVGSKASSFSLSDINLQLTKGETHALVGESGSGKSLTALSILRLLEGITAVKTKGSITFDSINTTQADLETVRKLRGKNIAMIFQEPMTSLNPVYTIGNQITEAILLHQQLDEQQARLKSIELLDKTGVQNPEYRVTCYPHQLSGGQRQRAMIAMALACKPQLLIADEPTTALDITTQGQILDLIKEIQDETKMAVLLITHDLNLVKKRSGSVSIMQNGKIVEQGPTKKIFSTPQNPYTIKLLNSTPKKIRGKRTATDSILKLKSISCFFQAKRGFHLPFSKNKNLITGVDSVTLDVLKKRTLGIVGESGSGKSTLAQCVLGLLPYQGDIFFNHNGQQVNLSQLSAKQMRAYRKNLQIVFQDPFSSLSPRMTIQQIVSEGLEVHESLGTLEKEKRVQQVLADVELEPECMHRFPHEFSGGQRQRIAIARAIILRPKLLILDEPTSALDMTIQKQILVLLERLQEKFEMSYIFISHDLRTIRLISDYIAVMQQGRIIEHGENNTIISNPENEYTKMLFDAALN